MANQCVGSAGPQRPGMKLSAKPVKPTTIGSHETRTRNQNSCSADALKNAGAAFADALARRPSEETMAATRFWKDMEK